MVDLAISGLSLMLPTAQYILMGMTFSMIVYILLNYQVQTKLYGSVKMESIFYVVNIRELGIKNWFTP